MRRAIRPFAAVSFRPRRQAPSAHYTPETASQPLRERSASFIGSRPLQEAAAPPELSTRVYAHLIYENAHSEYTSAANVGALLREMESKGFVPDASVCHAALRALAIHPDPMLQAAVIEYMRERWISVNNLGLHDIVAGQLKNGQIEEAIEGVYQMRAKGETFQPWLLEMAMHALFERNEITEALRIMQERVNAGEITIAPSTWYGLFDAACLDLHYDAIVFVWQQRVEQDQLNPSDGQCLAVLQTAANNADVSLATGVFRILSNRATSAGVASIYYELLIDSYLNVSDFRTSLSIFCTMNAVGTVPTVQACRSLGNALYEAGHEGVTKAVEIMHDLHGQQPNRPLPSAVLDTLIRMTIETARQSDEPIPDPHDEGRPRLIAGVPLTPLDALDDPADTDLCIALGRMRTLYALGGAPPSTNAYATVMARCSVSRSDAAKPAATFLAGEMLDRGVEPDAAVYDALVNVCLADMRRARTALADLLGAQIENDQREKELQHRVAVNRAHALAYMQEVSEQGFKLHQKTLQRLRDVFKSENDGQGMAALRALWTELDVPD